MTVLILAATILR